MTETKTVGHVHTALLAILADLAVEKGGTLPASMGGRSYITASDLSNETKRKFVEHGLIILPTEVVEKHEVIGGAADRKTVAIGITGFYEIFSTIDGSSVVVSGTGDGLAIGTAVATNIASTNALKNALLRTFLVTETSVEDQAKEGVKESLSPVAGPRAAAPDAEVVALVNRLKAQSTKVDGPLKGQKYLESVMESEADKFARADGTIPKWTDISGDVKALTVLAELTGA